jgi:hypothetical protein
MLAEQPMLSGTELGGRAERSSVSPQLGRRVSLAIESAIMTTASDAADLIETMARSVAEDHRQFHYTAEAIGAVASNTGPGSIGHNVAPVTTGGRGDFTGVTVDRNGAQVRIEHAVTAHREDIAVTLRSMAAELRSDNPDRGQLHRWIEMLRDKAAPGVIVAVVTALVAAI